MKCLQCGRRILDVEAGCPDSYCKKSNISSPVALPGARDRSGTYLIRGKTQRELIAKRTRSLPKRNEWGPVKWFLFSMAISVVAGSTVALEYYRSFSPMEEIPNLVANLETVNPTGLNSVARIPGRGSELIPTPTPTPTPTHLTPTPALTDSKIFEKNDNGEISDAEAKRLLSKVIYEGESEGQLADEVKGILERVWTEEGEGKKFFINLTQVPIDSTETNGFPRLKFQEPNKATFVMPDGPTEISDGLVLRYRLWRWPPSWLKTPTIFQTTNFARSSNMQLTMK